MTSTDPRRALGAAGERLAAAHLEARGLTLLAHNYRTRQGELDLVAADARYLVFCEVKTCLARGTPDAADPLTWVGPRKRRRLRLMARDWLAARTDSGPRPPEMRFDAIGITLDKAGSLVSLEHIEGAF